MRSNANDIIYKLLARRIELGVLTLEDCEKEFHPKIDGAHWRKFHRFKKRLEKASK